MNRRYLVIASRAKHRCEYCHAPEEAFNFHFELEHIIPASRGGADDDDNCALACTACNLFKSDHLGAVDEVTQAQVELFHPRLQQWEDHFRADIETGLLEGRTPTGRATINCLRINSTAQVRARLRWIRFDLFP